MRTRTLALAAASGAALLASAVLPATARDARVVGVPASASEGSVSAAALLAKVTTCSQISQGKYKTDTQAAATVPVCGKIGAVFWKADLHIDCDGQTTAACNEDTDPWFQPDTRFRQSNGKSLNAEKLPYVVVPSAGPIWNYASAGIKGGGAVAVIYHHKVVYAVVGDTGPSTVTGEASYATAKALGIDPDPKTGGADSGVTYILFKNSQVKPIESHSAAVSLGEKLARRFLANN
ncbi:MULTISPECIES: glycoside hydrolase family 75 protein [unclassified Streptomyces]|uniref:glycoside hydrolase family 75 protein n=1 Tax=unclassified Streptomyces TaxID=2593676 RepID=UPI003809F014